MNELREYQGEAVQACFGNDIGRIVLPTASGKTIIALEYMARRIKSEGNKVFVVFVPRLMLAKQWIKKTADVLITNHHLNINFVNVNTGQTSAIIKREIEIELFRLRELGSLKSPVYPMVNAMNPNEIRKQTLFFQRNGSSVIVICTYHSCQALLAANLEVDTMFADECHFIVSDNEFFACTKLRSTKKFYLTATPRFTDSDDGKGMNNEEAYGPIIYEKKPYEMIAVGAIVAPRVHVVTTDRDTNSEDGNTLSKLVWLCLLKHKEVIKQNSCAPDKIGAKLLILCNGQMELERMLTSRYLNEVRKENPQLKVFGLCTEYGMMINGKHIPPVVTNAKKEEFLLALDRMEPNDDALIFHVDMIGEGLDVPAITGILPLRNCGKVKFLQNEGRAGRPHPEDMANMRDKKLVAGDFSNYIKPYCYVILPYCVENKEDFVERFTTLVMAMKTDFKFDPSEHVIIDALHGAQKGPEFDDDLKRQIRSKVLTTFEEIIHIVEQDNMQEEEMRHLIDISRIKEKDDRLLFIEAVGRMVDRKRLTNAAE